MPPEQQMPQAPEWKRKIEAYRETLAKTELEAFQTGAQLAAG